MRVFSGHAALPPGHLDLVVTTSASPGYHPVGGAPKAVARTTEDTVSKPGFVVVTSERLVGSTWRRSVQQRRDAEP